MDTTGAKPTIAITGASGFIGTALAPFLEQHGFRVVRFVRRPVSTNASNERLWNPLANQIDPEVFSGIDVIIHLAGKNLGDRRWSAAEKEDIRNSRIVSTELLSKALAKLANPPKVFLSASAIGFYGNRDDETTDESSKKGSGFLPDLCRDWESATKAAVRAGIRVVQLRTGILLSKDSGALARMLPIFRSGLGGTIGSGNQYMSWISLHDYLRAILHIIQCDSLRGPVNLVAPHATTNKNFTKALSQALVRPALFSVPNLVIKLLWGEMGTALLLGGCKVLPKKLIESGFHYHDENINKTLKNILAKP